MYQKCSLKWGSGQTREREFLSTFLSHMEQKNRALPLLQKDEGGRKGGKEGKQTN